MTGKTIFAAAFSFAVFSSSAAVYVNCNAQEGGDGASWASACRNLHDAIALASTLEDKTIFVAEGVYYASSVMTLSDGMRIYGGFAGFETGTEAQMISGRDWDARQTVISSDLNKNDKWICYRYGASSLEAPQATETDIPVIDPVSGKVVIPELQGDFTTFAIKHDIGNYTKSEVFSVPAGAAATLDGIWFASCNSSWNATVNVLGGASQSEPCVIRNCRFVAHLAAAYKDNGNDRTCTNIIENCLFFGSSAVPVRYSGYEDIAGCSFKSISIPAAAYNGIAGFSGTKGQAIFRDSVFSHCVVKAPNQANRRSSIVAGGQWSSAAMYGCTVTNCLAMGSELGSAGIIGTGSMIVEKSYFANNRVNALMRPGESFSLIVNANGRSSAHSDFWAIEGCSFVSNTVCGFAPEGATGQAALGIVGTQVSSKGYMGVINSTFFGNRAEVAGECSMDVTKSRGILADISSTTISALAVMNCTFAGEEAADLADIAQFGVQCAQPLNIVNCIFSSGGLRASPFSFTLPSAARIESCSVKNGGTVQGASCSVL